VADPSKKVPDLNCQVQGQDLLLEAVDLKQEVPDLRSSGIPPPQFNPWLLVKYTQRRENVRREPTIRYDTIRDAILTCARKPT